MLALLTGRNLQGMQRLIHLGPCGVLLAHLCHLSPSSTELGEGWRKGEQSLQSSSGLSICQTLP